MRLKSNLDSKADLYDIFNFNEEKDVKDYAEEIGFTT